MDTDRLLLIVDPQIDFITGSLAVDGAPEAMDRLAAYVDGNGGNYSCIVVTADRHPYRHCSFEEAGGPWPRHCVADSAGAAVWPALFEALYAAPVDVTVLYKGQLRTRDEYSIFKSGRSSRRLAGIIRDNGIKRIDICGIAGDVCVADTLADGIALYGPAMWHVLADFCPSLDGGTKLNDIIASYSLSCIRL